MLAVSMGPAIQPPLSAPAKDFSKEKLSKFNVFLAEPDSANKCYLPLSWRNNWECPRNKVEKL